MLHDRENTAGIISPPDTFDYKFVFQSRKALSDPRSLLNHNSAVGLQIFWEPIVLWALCSLLSG